MKVICVFLILYIVISFLGCNSCKYANAVKKDAKINYIEKKNYIYTLSFKGNVKSKEECEICDINKYRIIVNIKYLSRKVDFSDKMYLPYYSFISDSVMLLSVNYFLYKQLSIGETVNKLDNSRYLTFRDTSMELLNRETNLWIP